MTGPEHYAKAAKYLAMVEGADYSNPDIAGTIAAAQAHATLALAAATALGVADGPHVAETHAARDWRKVIS